MSYKTSKNNNHFFSPLKIIQNKNAIKSQYNIFTSSEKKKKSLEKSLDFLSKSIKKSNEEEYEEIIKKRNNLNKKIDEVILLLSQKKIIKDQPKISKNNEINKYNKYNKYLFGINKKSKNIAKIKQNKNLKERNIYLKKIIKEIRAKNELNNYKNINVNNNNNLTYDFLLKQNKELNNENKNLKEEYNILQLEHKSNTTLERINDNKYEVISKMKSLKFSLNNLLNLLSNSNLYSFPSKPQTEVDKISYNNNLLKTHTISKYDLPLKKDFYPEQKTIGSNQNNNIIFTEGGNLNTNTNNNNSLDNDIGNYNFNEESSDNEQIEISSKQLEKIENRNFNNLNINSGGLNNNNKISINKNHTENFTTRQNENKKISIFTEKRKNTMATNSYNKDMINSKKMKKDFKKFFNEEINNNGENNSNTNYNFFNFRNIYSDKKILFENNKNCKNNSLKNNRTSSNFKINKINQKNNKGIKENFRIKNIYQKKFNINDYSNDFRKMIAPSKKIFKFNNLI